ncbi:putative phage protein (fragment) [Clostridium neonatale]
MYFDGPNLKIKTLEGDMKASVGDFIIQGIKGELYACKPDVFEKTYELAD